MSSLPMPPASPLGLPPEALAPESPLGDLEGPTPEELMDAEMDGGDADDQEGDKE